MADNPTSKFKFISPGVFVDEIDNSQLPATPGAVGPMVIGRARKGPAMEPVTVSSFSDFIDTFGEPIPGNQGDDVSRFGNTLGATYAPYAAQAWLKNSNPLTFMRTVGVQDPDATSDGLAGWKAGTLSATPSEGGAFGLFLWPSGSLIAEASYIGAQGNNVVTGALAAVFYNANGRVLLEGVDGLGILTASAGMLLSTRTNGDIDLKISSDGTVAALKKVTVSLNPDRNNFIRKVLNTNPTITNTSITRTSTATSNEGGKYWLGETFEYQLKEDSTTSIGVCVPSGGSDGGADLTNSKAWAAILPLRNQQDNTNVANDFNYAAQKGSTGFFFAQQLTHPTPESLGGAGFNESGSFDALNQQKLFRLEARTAGDWAQNTIKVSIVDIKAPRGGIQKYGTFSVLVRDLRDNDNNPVILERYDQCDLNPASPNYLAAKIGDKFMTYDSTDKRNKEYGTHENRSKYIRVVMDEDVEAGVTSPEMLPFGVFGPLTYRSVSITSGSSGLVSVSASARGAGTATALSGVRGGVASMLDGGDFGRFGALGGNAGDDAAAGNSGILSFYSTQGDDLGLFTASVIFPSVPLRKKSDWGSPKNLKSCFWGAWTGRTNTDTLFNPSIIDHVKPRVKGLQSTPYSTDHDLQYSPEQGGAVNDPVVISWHFTLDDVSGSVAEGYEFISGSCRGTATGSTGLSVSRVSASYSGALDAGIDRFTTVLHGGFEGFNVTEKDPFRLSGFNTANNETTSYQLHTLKRAINIVSDPEDAQYNIITMPGIAQENVTDALLQTTEERADSLAIIDIDKIYDAETENTKSVAARNAYTIKQATDALKDRNINNSYGATYAPWVLARDTLSSRNIWMPPSVAALGVLASVDRNAYPWFAPAGFTRGGLSEGAAGLPILDVSKKLSQDDRDKLYENNINPIAKFPAEGIVVFGQKTLQQTRSALDRINVRRLMIFLKRELSFIASRLLFDQNTAVTWSRFNSQAKRVLDDVQSQFGIQEFRLVLDETTTTPDLVDQNIIYAKLLVKPTRAVEFFAIDFVVMSSGASFDD
jgi:hypothetical protein